MTTNYTYNYKPEEDGYIVRNDRTKHTIFLDDVTGHSAKSSGSLKLSRKPTWTVWTWARTMQGRATMGDVPEICMECKHYEAGIEVGLCQNPESPLTEPQATDTCEEWEQEDNDE